MFQFPRNYGIMGANPPDAVNIGRALTDTFGPSKGAAAMNHSIAFPIAINGTKDIGHATSALVRFVMPFGIARAGLCRAWRIA